LVSGARSPQYRKPEPYGRDYDRGFRGGRDRGRFEDCFSPLLPAAGMGRGALVELDDHCEIMFKFLIEALQLVIDTFSMLDHIQLHLLLSFMYSWRDCSLTHCVLAMMIHVFALGGSFLQLALCLLHLFLSGVCEEFGDNWFCRLLLYLELLGTSS
jgi:hypothetical protein